MQAAVGSAAGALGVPPPEEQTLHRVQFQLDAGRPQQQPSDADTEIGAGRGDAPAAAAAPGGGARGAERAGGAISARHQPAVLRGLRGGRARAVPALGGLLPPAGPGRRRALEAGRPQAATRPLLRRPRPPGRFLGAHRAEK